MSGTADVRLDAIFMWVHSTRLSIHDRTPNRTADATETGLSCETQTGTQTGLAPRRLEDGLTRRSTRRPPGEPPVPPNEKDYVFVHERLGSCF